MDEARLVRTGLPADATPGARALDVGWTLVSTAPGAAESPAALPEDAGWSAAVVPGTVAMSVGPEALDGHDDYDASDWWYHTSFEAPAGSEAGSRVHLRCDGLATLAEVWLNGEPLLASTNMFCAHSVDVTDALQPNNDLHIVFRSLAVSLAQRRPRGRWKTKLVASQQLRWMRTTLLGRIPGWTPAIAPVGPWRGVWLVSSEPVSVDALDLRADVVDGSPRLSAVASGRVAGADGTVHSARLRCGDATVPVEVESADGSWSVEGSGSLPDHAPWWPRTHGTPALHDCALELETADGTVTVDCGRVGFRSIEVDETDGGIHLLVNGERVFCRGACWTTSDIRALGSDGATRAALETAAAGNANMIRVGGTMVYESDAFYDACDALGLMVWQDFMFANMDYPVDDEDFRASVEAEARQQLLGLQKHASVVAFCGGSEVEQQAAMFGADPSIWTNDFFGETLPTLIDELAPGTPYWTSTPTGGSLPFHVGEGLTHYYGVGAYKRPLSDVRLAGVRFTPECLGFSNVPDADNLRRLTPAGAVAPHDPAWKRGVPRDSGAGWDFEDIRDHYLHDRYGEDAVTLRSEDPDRYLALSRLVTGEVMERVFDEWRAEEAGCGGAIVWFFNDLRPGAGWGIIDSDGAPKAAYHHLRRAWAPRTVRLLDRGLDGLVALALNESAEALEGEIELLVVARGSVQVGHATVPVEVPGRSRLALPVEDALGHFVDSTYSYRFGPPRHEAVVARLRVGGELLAEDVYRPIPAAMTEGGGVSAEVGRVSDDELVVTVTSESALYGVRIDVRDFRSDDNYLCLTPGQERKIPLRRVADSGKSFKGYVEAVNLADPIRLGAPD